MSNDSSSASSTTTTPLAAIPRTFWPNIHVSDLSRLFIEIIESAVFELEEGGESKVTWNENGYYFAENGVHYWNDVEEWVVEEGVKLGYLSSSLLIDTNATNNVTDTTSSSAVITTDTIVADTRNGGDDQITLTREDLTKAAGFALFNTETSCVSVRARRLFGWEPKVGRLSGEMERIVRGEWERLRGRR